jgi:hypothetical protein
MAGSIGVEPIHRFPSEGLAIPCLNRSANYPVTVYYNKSFKFATCAGLKTNSNCVCALPSRRA